MRSFGRFYLVVAISNQIIHYTNQDNCKNCNKKILWFHNLAFLMFPRFTNSHITIASPNIIAKPSNSVSALLSS